MFRPAVLLGALLLMGGCQSGPSTQEKERYAVLNAFAMSEQAKCEATLKRGTMRSYSSYMACMNSAEEQLRSIYPYPDLLDMKIAARKNLGEKIDAALMTFAEAEVEFSKVTSSVVAETERRQLAVRTVAAQEAEASRAKTQQALLAIAAIGAGAAAGVATVNAQQPAFDNTPSSISLRAPVSCNSTNFRYYVRTNCF